MIRCHHVTVGAQGEIKWCGGRIISLAESLVAAVLSCHELEDVRKIWQVGVVIFLFFFCSSLFSLFADASENSAFKRIGCPDRVWENFNCQCSGIKVLSHVRPFNVSSSESCSKTSSRPCKTVNMSPLGETSKMKAGKAIFLLWKKLNERPAWDSNTHKKKMCRNYWMLLLLLLRQ